MIARFLFTGITNWLLMFLSGGAATLLFYSFALSGFDNMNLFYSSIGSGLFALVLMLAPSAKYENTEGVEASESYFEAADRKVKEDLAVKSETTDSLKVKKLSQFMEQNDMSLEDLKAVVK